MSNMRTIRVTGKVKIKVKPDMTRITMSLEGIYRQLLHGYNQKARCSLEHRAFCVFMGTTHYLTDCTAPQKVFLPAPYKSMPFRQHRTIDG